MPVIPGWHYFEIPYKLSLALHYPGFVICVFPDVWFILHLCLSARSIIYFVSSSERRSAHHIMSFWKPYNIFRIQSMIIRDCKRPVSLYSAVYEYCWRLLVAFSKAEIKNQGKPTKEKLVSYLQKWITLWQNIWNSIPPSQLLTTTRQKAPTFEWVSWDCIWGELEVFVVVILKWMWLCSVSLYVKYREKDFQKCLHDSRTIQKQNERVNPQLNS